MMPKLTASRAYVDPSTIPPTRSCLNSPPEKAAIGSAISSIFLLRSARPLLGLVHADQRRRRVAAQRDLLDGGHLLGLAVAHLEHAHRLGDGVVLGVERHLADLTGATGVDGRERRVLLQGLLEVLGVLGIAAVLEDAA